MAAVAQFFAPKEQNENKHQGMRAYFQAKIDELEAIALEKRMNLRRLEAQRNELNTKGEARKEVMV